MLGFAGPHHRLRPESVDRGQQRPGRNVYVCHVKLTGYIAETASGSTPDVGRLINSFVAQQRQGRVLIGVDDAHLLDGLSAHVVHQLAQTRGPRLVVTVRSGEPEPDVRSRESRSRITSRRRRSQRRRVRTCVMNEGLRSGWRHSEHRSTRWLQQAAHT